MVMGTAFLGYVLPWGQISFWGATVITNLLRSLPFVGPDLVLWLWGGFAVENPTLSRFYALHFLFPFLIRGLSVIHIFLLHQTGSNNPLGLNSDPDKVPFHWYYSVKDVFGFTVFLSCFAFVIFFSPFLFFEADNFIEANPLITPPHILPEWYFLFAYAILRCIPTKLAGTGFLFLSILLLGFLAPTHNRAIKSLCWYGPLKFVFWRHVSCFFCLTIAGSWPVAEPYIFTTQILSTLYVSYFLSIGVFRALWEEAIL